MRFTIFRRRIMMRRKDETDSLRNTTNKTSHGNQDSEIEARDKAHVAVIPKTEMSAQIAVQSDTSSRIKDDSGRTLPAKNERNASESPNSDHRQTQTAPKIFSSMSAGIMVRQSKSTTSNAFVLKFSPGKSLPIVVLS